MLSVESLYQLVSQEYGFILASGLVQGMMQRAFDFVLLAKTRAYTVFTASDQLGRSCDRIAFPRFNLLNRLIL